MRFGLQKLTLLDYPGVMACTVFTAGCNFRCPFCHNGSLVTGGSEALPFSEEELFAFLDSRKKMLEGVCITGGEPLLHREIPSVIRRIKEMGYKVKLDTNGSFPDRLHEILSEGCVDYVAMDIKHSQAKYALACGLGTALEQVKKSVDLLRNSSVEFEFRTTVVSGLHTPGDMEEAARWISGVKRYYLQNFTDSGDILLPENSFSAVDGETLTDMLCRVRRHVPAAVIRGK